MDNLIKTYDDVIDKRTCKNLIDKFEQFQTQHEEFDVGGMCFTQLNMTKSSQMWSKEIEEFTNLFQSYLLTYLKDTGVTPQQMPSKYIWEPIRLKRYMPNDHDEFKPHVDVNSKQTSTRFLVFFVYLSDNEEGKTTFPQLDKYAECKKGSMLMFPPMWPWLHAGTKPINEPKYIMQTYLHYV
jgi:hypothetical protein|tara:strand:- start:614 stop:1159 length:546 start_codon:yes stop_codon:yes gene_type:complete